MTIKFGPKNVARLQRVRFAILLKDAAGIVKGGVECRSFQRAKQLWPLGPDEVRGWAFMLRRFHSAVLVMRHADGSSVEVASRSLETEVAA